MPNPQNPYASLVVAGKPTEIELPDGQKLNFPAGTSPDAIQLRVQTALKTKKPAAGSDHTDPFPSVWRGVAEGAGEIAKGAAKVVGQTAVGAAEMGSKLTDPMVSKGAQDQGAQMRSDLRSKIGEPTGGLQKVGAFGAEMGSFFAGGEAVTTATKALPIMKFLTKIGTSPAAASLVTRAVEGLGQAGAYAGLSKAQGKTPEMGVAAFNGLVPFAGEVLKQGAPWLAKQAVIKLARVLEGGPSGGGLETDYAIKTGKAASPSVSKAAGTFLKAASDMLDLPIKTIWGAWAHQYGEMVHEAGTVLGKWIKGPGGDSRLPYQSILDGLDDHAAALKNIDLTKAGTIGEIPVNKMLIGQLETLKKELLEYGTPNDPTISVRSLVNIKRGWDDIVYALKDTGKVVISSDVLMSTAQKAAAFHGANAIRELLTRAPAYGGTTIEALDEAVHNAKTLRNLVDSLFKSQPAMTKGASDVGTAGAGLFTGISAQEMGVGHGFWVGSVIGYAGARLLGRAMASPRWATMNPQVKSKIADAIVAGKGDTVLHLLSSFVSEEGTGEKPPAPAKGQPQTGSAGPKAPVKVGGYTVTPM